MYWVVLLSAIVLANSDIGSALPLETNGCVTPTSPHIVACIKQTIPNYDPTITDQKYKCCYDWVLLDCYNTVGRVDCTPSEYQTVQQSIYYIARGLLDMNYGSGECRFNRDIETSCSK
ncbi:unnamed protein product [Medioppia subpectinata]|uniref:Uncharacterized protein n=1 Tax=Medioppia subpectinata TaxID=1979941 RepID=A0A7R9L9S1_9ACAR|nr:unnamed protein product [Medioppia subpectinata]CAG2117074.1 unnamed protein product [Medioppia subpectinata]